MSNPSVAIDLKLTHADMKAALADIKGKIQSALGSMSFGNISTGIKASIADFKGWSFTIQEGVNKAINTFYKVKNTLSALPDSLRAFSSAFHAVIDFIEASAPTAFKKLGTVASSAFAEIKAKATALKSALTAQNIGDTLQYGFIRAKHVATQTFNSIKATGIKAFQTLMNTRIHPAAMLSGLASIASAVKRISFSSLHAGVISLASALRTAGGALTNFSSHLARIPGLIGRSISAMTRFAFSFKGIMAASAAGGAVWGVFKTGEISEELERAQWKFNIVYDKVKEKANSTAKEIASVFRANLGSVQSQMSRSADVISMLGLDPDVMLEMTRNIAMLSQGAAAWTEGRYDAERASTAMMKALTGEKEMLKEMGPVINDKRIFDTIKAQGKEITRVNYAITVYNEMLKLTKNMQSAAFGRIQEFTGRFAQLKDSIKTLMGAVGQFTRPIITEIMYLFGAINRKIAEILGTDGFGAWKTASENIAASIKKIADAIEGIDASKIKDQFAGLKDFFKEISAAFGTFITDALGAVMDAILPKITSAIKNAVQVGVQVASDITGSTRRKAESIKAQAEDPNWLKYGAGGFFGGMETKLAQSRNKALTGYDVGEKVRQSDLDWANRFLGADTLDKGMENLGKTLERISSSLNKRVSDAASNLAALGGPAKPKPLPGFGKEIGLPEGSRSIDPKDKLSFDRMQTALKALRFNREALEGRLTKADQPAKQASMSGIADAYTDMLVRAAGGGKKGTKESVEDLQKSIELIADKEKNQLEAQTQLLDKIATEVGKDKEVVVKMMFGR